MNCYEDSSQMFFQNNDEVFDHTTGVNLLSVYPKIYIFCYLVLLRSKNNNFSFTGIEICFVCQKLLTN